MTPGAEGPPTIIDSLFPESKGFLAGFWIVDVDAAQEALPAATRQ